jgi:hypothetical protein
MSYSQLARTREYIQKQELHHQTQPFEDEYIKFLNLHELTFDPQYVFD